MLKLNRLNYANYSLNKLNKMREIPVSEKPVQDFILATLWGTLWGVLVTASVIGTRWITVKNNWATFLASLALAMFWCSVLAMLWKFLMTGKDAPSRPYIVKGLIWGLFLGLALLGVIYGFATKELAVGMIIFWGAIAGTILGFLWHWLKPPLVLHTGRIHGKMGALLGATWGSWIGLILGLLLLLGAIATSQGALLSFDKLGAVLLMVVMFGGGSGAIGGMLAGAIVGGIVIAKPLPFSLELAGPSGAFLGCIWGCFLGVLGGAVLGGILLLINPDIFYDLGFQNSANLFQAIASISGIGGLWGIFSGAVWGGIGKW